MAITRKGGAPVPIRVDPAEIQRMQQGYEIRLARQRDSIDRLVGLLEERTNDVAMHMMRANEAARVSADANDQLPMLVAARELAEDRADMLDHDRTAESARTEVLIRDLVPNGWSTDHLPETFLTADEILRRYVQWLSDEVDHQRGKQVSIGQQMGELKDRLVPSTWRPRGHEGEDVLDDFGMIDQYVTALKADNDRLRAEGRNMVALTKAMPVTDGDDTPPWDKPGYRPPTPAGSGVADTRIERDTTTTPAPHPAELGDSETLGFEGFGGSGMPPGERRPGGF
jgi:hypothetical protein